VSLVLRLLCATALAAVLFVPATSRADDDDDKPEPGAVLLGAVSDVSAEVSATLRLGDGETWYAFAYKATGGSRQWTAWVKAARDRGRDIAVAATLSGLAPATPYEVLLVANGEGDPVAGKPASFTTAAAPSTPPAESPGPTPAPPATVLPDQPDATPDLGVSVVAAAESGAVRVRLPGSDEFVDLPATASVPVGTVVDARRGTLALTTALPGGGVQQGSFKGAKFQIRQTTKGGGYADLHLRGGSFAGCRQHSTRRLASAATTKPKKPVRRLWGKDRSGRFRTHGRDSVTTVRGTEWKVADRCDGTVTRVTEGAVDVRVRRTERVLRVEAGERFVAPHAR
jgi:hypothetical protein